jgi:aspartyl-tRNA(Asn)/glutamyl-tRNA(Gln) amidotransferase subunit C
VPVLVHRIEANDVAIERKAVRKVAHRETDAPDMQRRAGGKSGSGDGGAVVHPLYIGAPRTRRNQPRSGQASGAAALAPATGLCYRAAASCRPTPCTAMSIDAATVRRIAHLARIAIADDEVEHLRGEINAILAFVEQLQEVDVAGVEPMTSVIPMRMKTRPDVVTDGGIADDVLKNAPEKDDHYFVVPKVIE